MGLTRAERARIGQLRIMLVQGRLAPGDSVEFDSLAAALQTDADGVRAAVAELARDGVVDLLPGGTGFVVRDQPDRPDETVEVRLRVEPQAVREAAARARIADLLTLRGLADAMTVATDREDYGAFRAAHEAFHATLLACHPNTRLAELVTELTAATPTDGLRQLVETGAGLRSGAEHGALVDLIEAGDLDGVQAQVSRWLGDLRYLGAPVRDPGEPAQHVDAFGDDLVPFEGEA